MGRKKLRRVQIGFETTNGTHVPTTWRLRTPGVGLDDNRVFEDVPEDVGVLIKTDRTIMPYADGKLALSATGLTPEDYPYMLATGLGAPITGTADGTGSSGFRYSVALPVLSAPAANRSLTVETGDDFEVERAAYGKFTEWAITGTQKKNITLTGTITTQNVERFGTTFSPTTLVDRDDLLFARSRMWLDPASGTIGTTPLVATLLGYDLAIKPMWVMKQTGEGIAATVTPTYNLLVYTDLTITGKITFEYDSVADGATGIKNTFRQGNTLLMRLDMYGRNYTTAGTGTLFSGRRGIRHDMAIRILKVPPFSDIDGNTTVSVDFECRYNATFGSAGIITVANERATL